MRAALTRDRAVLPTLVVAYASFYLCRANVEAAFPLLQDAFGFHKTELGLLTSIPLALYAVGKIVTGALGEVIGGKRLLLLGMVGSIAATLAFGTSSSLAAFIAFASLNRLFQSGGWSGAVGVVARRFQPARHGGVMGVLSTSYLIGDVVAIHLCAFVARVTAGWRGLFVVNPVLLAAIAGLVAFALPGTSSPAPAARMPVPPVARMPVPPAAPRGPRDESSPPPAAARVPPAAFPAQSDESSSREVGRAEVGALLLALARKPAFWMVLLLSVLLTFLRVSFVTWTATYLTDLSLATGARAVSGAIAKSSLFPAAGVVAALVIGPLSDRFGPGRRAPVMAGSLAMVFLLVLALAHAGPHSPASAALLVGGVGLFLFGPYSLPSGAMALDVSSERGASVAAGAIDGAGYLGATAAGVVLGRIADTHGWTVVFDVIAAVALAATLVTVAWAARTLGGSRPSSSSREG